MKRHGTPPTILRNAPVGALNKRDGVDPVHYADLVGADLDLLHERADDFPTRRPISLVQTLFQLLGELLKFADHQTQFGALRCFVGQLVGFAFQTCQTLFAGTYLRLEFLLFQKTFTVSIDQPSDAALELADARRDVVNEGRHVLLAAQPPLIFRLDLGRLAQQLAHVAPDHFVQRGHVDRRIGASWFVGVLLSHAARTTVRTGGTLGRTTLGLVLRVALLGVTRLATPSITAGRAHEQALQQE